MLEILTALILFKITDAILQRFGDIQSYTELQTLCALITTRLCYYNFAKWMEICFMSMAKYHRQMVHASPQSALLLNACLKAVGILIKYDCSL